MTTATDAGADTNPAGGQPQNADATGKPDAAADAANAAPDAAKGTQDVAKGAEGEGKAGDKPTEYQFKAPEGFELDEARLGEFKTLAAELKLPNEAAQKLIDLAAKAEQGRHEAYAKQVSDWATVVKADKELGGDRLQESVAIVRKAIELGPPELKSFLNDSGLGNHPLLFKWAHAIGKALSEDRFANGNTPASAQDTASLLYGGSKN